MNQFKTIAFKDGSISLDVRVAVEDGTIWLSASEMAEIFNCGASTARHLIKVTYNELDKQSCSSCSKKAPILLNGGRRYSISVYNEQIIKGVADKLKSDKFEKLKASIAQQEDKTTTSNNIIIYNNDGISLDVNVSPEEETVWLTQCQIALLFETSQPNISMHILNILNEGELTKDSVYKDFLYTAPDGKQYLVNVYNLDMILAVGYRVKGKRAIEFRKWATEVLKQYLIKGYAINDDRIKSYSDIILNIENETLRLRKDIDSLKTQIENGLVKEKLFINGQVFDAHEYFCSLMRQAKSSIKIIDPYFDDRGLAILSKSKRVDRTVYLSHPGLLNKKEIAKYKSQYGDVKIVYIKDYHDRFIIIDDIDCYLIGTSLNNAGAKTFVVIKLENKEIIATILKSIEH